MKQLKMLALAAVAAGALTAIAGVGSAQATVLCKVKPTGGVCPKGEDYPAGTEIKGEIATGEVVFNGVWTNVNCTSIQGEGRTGNTGGATETVEGALDAWTPASCKCAGSSTGSAHTTLRNKGTFQAHATDDEGNGTLIGFSQQVTINCTPLGTSCIFGTPAAGAILGTITGGSPATLSVNMTVIWFSGDSSSFLCGTTAKMEAHMKATSPSSLWVATSSA